MMLMETPETAYAAAFQHKSYTLYYMNFELQSISVKSKNEEKMGETRLDTHYEECSWTEVVTFNA